MPFAIPIAASAFLRSDFAKKAGKVIGVSLLVGGAYLAFDHWRDGLIEKAHNAGFAQAEAIYAAKVEAANQIIENDNVQMTVMATAFNSLATLREQDINVKISPIAERVSHEVAQDPVYRDCRVSDGMLGDIQSARAAGDAAIAAARPSADR